MTDTTPGLTEAEREAITSVFWQGYVPAEVLAAVARIKADAHAAGVAETLGRVRDGLTRGMHLHHDGEHWVSLPYVLDLLDAALVDTSPQGAPDA